MGRVVLLFLVVSCKFDSPAALDAGDGGEGGPCIAWEPRGGHIDDMCASAPGPSWRIGSPTMTYDTTLGIVSEGFTPRSFLISQGGSNMLRVVTVDDFEVAQGGSLRVVGPHPLLVLSWSTITVAGTIDASSRAGSVGAGGSRADCDPGDPGEGAANGGGGGGGGLGQAGAKGGDGNVVTAFPNAGGTAGGSISRPSGFVVGGCRGGNGGAGGGAGGDGGGAIQLTARVSITIEATARILAGGMGGQGAAGGGAGGGGGGGGFIGLDAPEVIARANAMLAANGGGGAAGCESTTGPPGQDGLDMNAAALGGSSVGCLPSGANGGNGGARGKAPVVGTDGALSGGGGGGGGGYIIVWTPSLAMLAGTRTPGEVHVPDPE